MFYLTLYYDARKHKIKKKKNPWLSHNSSTSETSDSGCAVVWEGISQLVTTQRSRFNTSPVHVGFCGGPRGSGTGIFFCLCWTSSISIKSPMIYTHSFITDTKYCAQTHQVCIYSTPQLGNHSIYRHESLKPTTVLFSDCILFIYLIYTWMRSMCQMMYVGEFEYVSQGAYIA